MSDLRWFDEDGRELSGWPEQLSRSSPAPGEDRDRGDRLRLRAGALTDRFVDPSGGPEVTSSPLVLTRADGDLLLTARFHVELRDTFDAVGLMVFADDHHWGKYALERSPQMEDTVVTVVTNGRSDDCNGPIVDLGLGVWLRVARIGSTYAFHDSLDGEHWRMRRLFTIGDASAHRVGLTIQAPTGSGLEAEVSELSLRQATLGDVRSGE